ncbi:MAG: cyclase family protein [bacterium]
MTNLNLLSGRVIDLSLPLSSETGIYPGDPNISISSARTMEKNNINILSMNMSTHNGTHLDAAYHQLSEGVTLDAIPAEHYINRATKVDLTGSPGGCAEKNGIKYKREIDAACLSRHINRMIGSSAAVLYTGYGKVIQSGQIDTDFPYLTRDAAELIVERHPELRVLGIDSVTVDAHKQKVAHHTMFKGIPDLIIAETMVNLDQLPQWFTLLTVPLLVEHSDGSPCRALAIV